MMYESLLWHSSVTWIGQVTLLYLINEANKENRLGILSGLPSRTVIKPHSESQTPNPVRYPLFQGGLVWGEEAGGSGTKAQAELLEARRLQRAVKRRQEKHTGRNLLANGGVGGRIHPSIKFVLGYGKSSQKSGNRAS